MHSYIADPIELRHSNTIRYDLVFVSGEPATGDSIPSISPINNKGGNCANCSLQRSG